MLRVLLHRVVVPVLLAGMLVGCAGEQERKPRASEPTPSTASAEGKKYILDTEPTGARPVLDARKEAKDGDAVVVVGRIGGSKKPMGQSAIFTVVDTSMAYCPEEENCPTPWDYCCTPKEDLRAATATVKFEADGGRAIPEDPKKLLGVKELDIVTVRGKARRDEAGNLVVLADGLFVRERYSPPRK